MLNHHFVAAQCLLVVLVDVQRNREGTVHRMWAHHQNN